MPATLLANILYHVKTFTYPSKRVSCFFPFSMFNMTINTQETAVNTHDKSTTNTENGSTPFFMIVPPHPLGIKPAGNRYTTSGNAKSAAGLFSVLPDEIIIQILDFLDETLLLRLGATCKALYAFSTFDELWKTLLIRYVFIALSIWWNS